MKNGQDRGIEQDVTEPFMKNQNLVILVLIFNEIMNLLNVRISLEDYEVATYLTSTLSILL